MIKKARLKGLGHRAGMEDNVSCMKIKFSQPEVNRKNGRPRLRWFVSVSKDHKILEVNVCWTKKEIGNCGVQSSVRPRHIRGCSTNEEKKNFKQRICEHIRLLCPGIQGTCCDKELHLALIQNIVHINQRL
jgi:hypothetical protein